VTSNNNIKISYGGPETSNSQGNIEITGGTAIAVLGFSIGQKALYKDSIAYNRYNQASNINIAIEVVAEDHDVRTEITDLVWSFFTFYLDEKDFTFYGRSVFEDNISNETYQV